MATDDKIAKFHLIGKWSTNINICNWPQWTVQYKQWYLPDDVAETISSCDFLIINLIPSRVLGTWKPLNYWLPKG